jgi:hypothetical protein
VHSFGRWAGLTRAAYHRPDVIPYGTLGCRTVDNPSSDGLKIPVEAARKKQSAEVLVSDTLITAHVGLPSSAACRKKPDPITEAKVPKSSNTVASQDPKSCLRLRKSPPRDWHGAGTLVG